MTGLTHTAAALAQLVERRIRNAQVISSSLIGGLILRWIERGEVLSAIGGD